VGCIGVALTLFQAVILCCGMGGGTTVVGFRLMVDDIAVDCEVSGRAVAKTFLVAQWAIEWALF